MNTCTNCNLEYDASASFCTACGRKLVKPQSKSEVSSFAQSSIYGDYLSLGWGWLKGLPRRTLVIAGALTLVGIILAANIGSQGPMMDQGPRALAVAFSADQLEASRPDCSKVAKSVNDGVDFANAKKLLSKAQSITDGRKAASAVSTSWYSVSLGLVGKYQEAVGATYVVEYQKLIRDGVDVSSQEQLAWSSEWSNYVLNSCDLLVSYNTNKQTLTELKDAAEGLRSLAASVPWYPDGYYETGNGVAWNWSSGGGCKFSSFGCWHMNVIAKDGCPSGLYAAINIVDSAGTVVGFTNDSLPGLAPMRKARLEFTNTTDYNSAEFQELNCY